MKKNNDDLQEQLSTLKESLAMKELEGKELLEAIECLKEDVEQYREEMRCTEKKRDRVCVCVYKC